MEQTKSQIKWCFRPIPVLIAILCAGPLALPLVWFSPAFKKIHKIVITIILIILTIWLVKASIDIYRLLLKQMQDLQMIF